MKSLNKIKIATIMICVLIFNQFTYAGQFYYDNGILKYIDDNGLFATGWRWIDSNGDNIAECYRFNDDGSLATSSKVKGKTVNSAGMWEVNGVVQQIYKSSGIPLYASNAGFGTSDTNKYLDLGTGSNTRRLNATKKDIKALIEADANKDLEDYKKSLIGPDGRFEKPKEGYVLSKGIKSIVSKRPIATKSSWHVIDDVLKEDEIIYLKGTESVVAGRDMRKFVSSSNKYTEKADNVKIWGGDIWNDVIVLQGNGAYAKFLTSDGKKFKANYFTFEVAHQTHGESTADTYCGVELYLNGKSVAVYDEFCDDVPEKVEEYLDDNETTMELRLIVTGDAPGRKVYIRNARFRQLRLKE